MSATTRQLPLKQRIRQVLSRATRFRFTLEQRKYRDATILSAEQANALLERTLLEGSPQGIAKFGATELGGVRRWLSHHDANGYCSSWGGHDLWLFRNAGVYPRDPAIHSRFAQEYLQGVSDLTILAVWFRWGEREVVRRYAPNATYCLLAGLEPYLNERPWSRALAGKRVLVITPFANTVESQYQRRKEVWAAHPEVLPDFELQTLKTPLSAALVPPVFPDWFTALEHFKAEMRRRQFDVAIVGAGAWSLPLAAYAKQLGRWGIHLGGGTQLLFGIRGRRWDDNPLLTRFYNDAWTRPSDAETPQTMTQVEGGCYW